MSEAAASAQSATKRKARGEARASTSRRQGAPAGTIVPTLDDETAAALTLFNTYLVADREQQAHERALKKAEKAKDEAAAAVRKLNDKKASASETAAAEATYREAADALRRLRDGDQAAAQDASDEAEDEADEADDGEAPPPTPPNRPLPPKPRTPPTPPNRPLPPKPRTPPTPPRNRHLPPKPRTPPTPPRKRHLPPAARKPPKPKSPSQWGWRPPSATMTWPVMNRPASLASSSAGPTISSGWAKRPSSVPAPIDFAASGP